MCPSLSVPLPKIREIGYIIPILSLDYLPDAYGYSQTSELNGTLFFSSNGHFTTTEGAVVPLNEYWPKGTQTIFDMQFKVSNFINASDSLTSLSPRRRKCFFPEERQLEYYPVYSQSNCILECSWKVIAEKYKCAPWYLLEHMPQYDPCDNNGNAWFQFAVSRRHEIENDCTDKCLPDCISVEYNLVSRSNLPLFDPMNVKCQIDTYFYPCPILNRNAIIMNTVLSNLTTQKYDTPRYVLLHCNSYSMIPAYPMEFFTILRLLSVLCKLLSLRSL